MGKKGLEDGRKGETKGEGILARVGAVLKWAETWWWG
jgi:hypothetical protein